MKFVMVIHVILVLLYSAVRSTRLSPLSPFLQHIAMATQQEFRRPRHERQPRAIDPPNPNYQRNLPRVPDVTFRVLIIGRANAGKTSILQRVCDTTESPKVYRLNRQTVRRRERVRSLHNWYFQSHLLVRFNSRLRQRLGMLILLGDG